MDFGLAGKVSIVTGAARGIGKAIAVHLGRAGSAIAICDLDEQAIQEAVQEFTELGITASGWVCNVADFSSVESFVSNVMSAFGKIDVLCNVAGITRDALLDKLEPEAFKLVIDVNLTGVWNMCKCVIPHMTSQQSGSVINISSIMGKIGGFGQSNYSAAKAGVIGMTKALAKETARKNVRVNCVLPGFVNTEMVQKIPQKVMDKLIADIPVRRLGTVDEIASLVQYLASDASTYCVGSIIDITGGYGM
ncbi:hypothetical protein RCL1_000666 [Eukaryota sp. TZLM3-RCL]